MEPTGSVTRLIDQLRSKDPGLRNAAAQQVWQRYFPQLLELARRHLDTRIRAREDEEDVLQNMYNSLCVRLGRGDFVLNNRSDLWQLLVTMTLNKTRKAAIFHTRDKRDFRRDQTASPAGADDSHVPAWVFEQMDQAEPDPAEAVELAEEFQRRLATLDPTLRQIALWRLEGYSNEEIAGPDKLDCAVRTVERKLNLIRQHWEGSPQST